MGPRRRSLSRRLGDHYKTIIIRKQKAITNLRRTRGIAGHKKLNYERGGGKKRPLSRASVGGAFYAKGLNSFSFISLKGVFASRFSGLRKWAIDMRRVSDTWSCNSGRSTKDHQLKYCWSLVLPTIEPISMCRCQARSAIGKSMLTET